MGKVHILMHIHTQTQATQSKSQYLKNEVEVEKLRVQLSYTHKRLTQMDEILAWKNRYVHMYMCACVCARART